MSPEGSSKGRYRVDETTGEVKKDGESEPAPPVKPEPERDRAANPGGYL